MEETPGVTHRGETGAAFGQDFIHSSLAKRITSAREEVLECLRNNGTGQRASLRDSRHKGETGS